MAEGFNPLVARNSACKKKAMDGEPSSMAVLFCGEEWNRTINQGLMSPLLYR
jgi:hypothetical protein